MTRNPNPTRIQDNNESASTIMNPSLTRIQDVGRNTKPIIIQDLQAILIQKGLKTPSIIIEVQSHGHVLRR